MHFHIITSLSDQWKLPMLPCKGINLRCSHCGSVHQNPELCDTYRYCRTCTKVMRESSELYAFNQLVRDENSCGLPKLIKSLAKSPSSSIDNDVVLLAASYGHATDPSCAANVLTTLQSIIFKYETYSILEISDTTNLIDLFKVNPAPDCLKVSNNFYN